MVEGGERAKNGRHGLLWIVNVAAMVWSSWDGRPWGELRMGDDEGEDLVDGKEWSEKRCLEDWRRTSLDFKRRNWLLKNKCEFRTRWIVKCENFHIPVHFRTEIFDGDREHAFWKMLTKAISHQGVEWCEFCTRELGGANFAGSWLFTPVLPCFLLGVILQAFLPAC